MSNNPNKGVTIMKTRFSLFIITVLTGILTACNGVVSVTPTLHGDPLTPTIAAKPTAQTVSQANVTCNGVSLSLDPSLGSGFECQAIPEYSQTDMGYSEIHPEYAEVTIKNYTFADSLFTPRIAVYPVSRFSELLPDLVPNRLADLQSLISGGNITSKDMPLLPPFNSVQMFQSQSAVIPFSNGTGIRFLTQYAQEMFYTFQGLTSDGKYWVSVILPISSANLMADGKNPPNGQTMEEFANNYKTYITNTASQLNGQSPESFTPAINQLDAMIKSIQVKP
jgi:hypothetical protein